MSDIKVGDRVRVVRGGPAGIPQPGEVGVVVERRAESQLLYLVDLGDSGDVRLWCAEVERIGPERVEPEADPVAELRAEVARLAERVTALESDELRRKKIKGTGSQ